MLRYAIQIYPDSTGSPSLPGMRKHHSIYSQIANGPSDHRHHITTNTIHSPSKLFALEILGVLRDSLSDADASERLSDEIGCSKSGGSQSPFIEPRSVSAVISASLVPQFTYCAM